MRVITNLIIIFLVCLCAGCGGRGGLYSDDDPAPVSGALAPVSSTINMPVEIKTAVIENLVHDLLGETFYRSDTTVLGGLTNIRISARRSGDIKITAHGDELSVSLPVAVAIRVSTTVSAMGLTHTEHQDVSAGIAVNLRSRVSLKNDWRIVTVTRAAGYRWTTEPVLKARFITIPIKPIADYFAGKLMVIVSPMIDKALANSDVVKNSVITPLWKRLYEPVSFTLPETRETIWMRFNPTHLYLSGLNGQGASISALVGIRAATEAVMGDKPEKREPAPLPDFTEPKGADSTFSVNLYAEVPYDKATAICKEMFNGRTFKSGWQKVKVNDVEITGVNADGLMVMKLDLSGALKGNVLVTGRAVYNDKDKNLSLADLNIDMTTANQYQKTKNQLLRGIIINKMKPLIKFPLSTMLDPKTLTKILLTNYPIQKGTRLNGKIERLTVRGVETTENAIRAVVLASGTARMTVADE